MSKRVCTEPGCPTLIDHGSRCTTHARARDAARGRRQARGYDRIYDRARASYQHRMDAGERFDCWRCAARRKPHLIDPEHWHLGHCDDDRTVIHGPECAAGNLATSGRTGCTHISHVM